MSLALPSRMQVQRLSGHPVKSPLCRFIGKLRRLGVWANGR